MLNNLRTCNNCGWVHFGVSREAAMKEVKEFNEFFDKATLEVQKAYGKKSSMADYVHCNKCGGSCENFSPFKEGDCPDGCTLGPIVVEQP